MSFLTRLPFTLRDPLRWENKTSSFAPRSPEQASRSLQRDLQRCYSYELSVTFGNVHELLSFSSPYMLIHSFPTPRSHSFTISAQVRLLFLSRNSKFLTVPVSVCILW